MNVLYLMDLTEIVQSTATGFLSGFLIGLSGFCDKCDETIELIDASLTQEEMKEEGLTKKDLSQLRNIGKRRKWLTPFIAGTLSSAIFWGSYENASILQNMAIAIPFAYLGKIAGGSLRKVYRRDKQKDLQIARQIKNDPENTLMYIPKEQKRIIESAFGEVEKRILEDSGIYEGNPMSDEGEFKNLYIDLKCQNKAYVTPLFKWAAKKFEKTCKTAYLQRKIKDFCEGFIPESSVLLLRKPEKPFIRVYEFVGDNVNIYSARFNGIKITERDGAANFVNVDPPEIKLDETRNWDGNYREMAEQITQSQPKHATMFMKTHPKTSKRSKEAKITSTFLQAFLQKMGKNPENYGLFL